MLNKEKFSIRIKKLRKQHNVTLEMLGLAIGVSKPSAHRWETGKNTPSTDNLIDIADFFDVSIDYLVGRSDDPKRY